MHKRACALNDGDPCNCGALARPDPEAAAPAAPPAEAPAPTAAADPYDRAALIAAVAAVVEIHHPDDGEFTAALAEEVANEIERRRAPPDPEDVTA